MGSPRPAVQRGGTAAPGSPSTQPDGPGATTWIPFTADRVLDLPPDLQAGWPESMTPHSVSCAVDAGPRTRALELARAVRAGSPRPDLSALWVARAAGILGGAPVVGEFHLLAPGLRIIASAGVRGRACCVVWRWVPSGGGEGHPSDGILFGRIDRAPRLPELVAGLVGAQPPRAVLGVLGHRGDAPDPWWLGDGGVGAGLGALRDRTAARVRSALAGAVLRAAGEVGPAAGAASGRRGADGA